MASAPTKGWRTADPTMFSSQTGPDGCNASLF
jgi:hypothetical protein